MTYRSAYEEQRRAEKQARIDAEIAQEDKDREAANESVYESDVPGAVVCMRCGTLVSESWIWAHWEWHRRMDR